MSLYVLNEPALSAPPPDDVGIWQELARLRTENHYWRECVVGIVKDTRGPHASADALIQSIEQRLIALAEKISRLHQD